MVRILIAESSAVIRDAIVETLRSDPQIDIIGLARNGTEAVIMTKRLRPDLVLMSVRLQKIDGFEATKELMIEQPTPIVLVTTERDPQDVELSVLALRAGALAVVPVPFQQNAAAAPAGHKLLSTIKLMSQVKVVRRWRETFRNEPPLARALGRDTPVGIVAIAASTGGPAALESILAELPGNFPVPILIVQHISNGFVDGVVSWLNRVSALKVKVAEHLESLDPHTVYIAADDRHLGVADSSRIMLTSEAAIGGFRPSATYLFESVARNYGPAALAIILTGMGQDGVEGLRAVRKAGGKVFAQDETSSVVFGMPRAAIAAGIVDQVLPLDCIVPAITALIQAPAGDSR